MMAPSKVARQTVRMDGEGAAGYVLSTTITFYRVLMKNAAENPLNFSCYAALSSIVRSYEWIPVSIKIDPCANL